MSRIYFHTPSDDAEVRGFALRAYLDTPESEG